ncbi:MAG: hypothetical protein Q7N50_10840 [Armatimonadota bacterium]|nr:hypothetical protein [Armatimonadota bacterium]
MTTMNVKDSAGATVAIEKPLAPGRVAASLSRPVVLSTEDAASLALHAVTQSGTWTVQPGNTANTTAWKVDGSAVTQPVSIATVPSHAVTNAGTFAVQLASVPSHAVTNAGTFAVQAASTISPGAAALSVSAINFASSGSNTVITAGAGGVTIKVYRLYLVVAAATNLTFVDGVVTDGAIPLAANEAIVLTFDGEPWFTGAAATAFIISSSAAVQVSGRIYYIKS